ncbi:MAG: hypothetical protein HQ514_01370 [Rhodospirillales bacterium]|nr:hypothetical protein [Rhodospirillales bacterium]
MRVQHLLILIWVLVLVRLIWPGAVPVAYGAGLMGLYVLASLARLRRQTQILCAVLAAVTLALAAAYDGWQAIILAADGATVFAAFFGTIMILRATADRRPETALARQAFTHFDRGQQSGAFLVASHLIGALLVVGVMAVLAPIQDKDASDVERRTAAEVCQRGMCLAPLWSPFWIAMAVAFQHLPSVPLWQIMVLGLPMAVGGLLLSHVMFARGVRLADLGRAVLALSPIVLPVALCAALITLLTGFTDLSTIQAVAVSVPPLCLLGLMVLGRGAVQSAAGSAYLGIGKVGDEIVLLTVALCLGRVLEQVLAEIGVIEWIAALNPPALSLIALTVVGMTVAALVGIHQVVSMTVMLVLLVPLQSGLSDLVLLESALVGWAFSSMIGVSAVSVAMAGAMFRVPLEQLVIGPNLKFVAAYGVAAIVVLGAVNRIM